MSEDLKFMIMTKIAQRQQHWLILRLYEIDRQYSYGIDRKKKKYGIKISSAQGIKI